MTPLPDELTPDQFERERISRGLSLWQLFSLTVILLVLMLTIWTLALWFTGAKVDYRSEAGSGFIALRLTPKAGLSYQWNATGQSVWFWRPDRNRRLWPVE